MKYFINENDTIEKLPESCYDVGFNQSQIATQNSTLSNLNNESGIIYPYMICGITVTVTGVIFYVLHCQNVLKKIGEQNASIEDKREDAPLNATLVCFFIAVIISLFGIQVRLKFSRFNMTLFLNANSFEQVTEGKKELVKFYI